MLLHRSTLFSVVLACFKADNRVEAARSALEQARATAGPKMHSVLWCGKKPVLHPVAHRWDRCEILPTAIGPVLLTASRFDPFPDEEEPAWEGVRESDFARP
jgi:hypothetical protein